MDPSEQLPMSFIMALKCGACLQHFSPVLSLNRYWMEIVNHSLEETVLEFSEVKLPAMKGSWYVSFSGQRERTAEGPREEHIGLHTVAWVLINSYL